MMAVKIAAVGSAQLPSGTEFPPLVVTKYGWEQYSSLPAGELADRCWRAEIVVLLWSDRRVDCAIMEKLPQLRLLIAVGESAARLDQAAARDRGVERLVFPQALGSDAVAAPDLCNRCTQAVHRYLRSTDSVGELP